MFSKFLRHLLPKPRTDCPDLFDARADALLAGLWITVDQTIEGADEPWPNAPQPFEPAG